MAGPDPLLLAVRELWDVLRRPRARRLRTVLSKILLVAARENADRRRGPRRFGISPPRGPHRRGGTAVAVWPVDAHSPGLLPVVRRVWAPRRWRPAAVRRRYSPLSVDGFVRPRTGRTRWCPLSTVRAEAFALALTEFARDGGIGPGRRAVVVLDNAGWHPARDLAVPDGVHLVFLPAYSPEPQPAERLWGPVDEPVAHCAFADLDDLEDALIARCRELAGQGRRIKGRTRHHWWPREQRPRERQ